MFPWHGARLNRKRLTSYMPNRTVEYDNCRQSDADKPLYKANTPSFLIIFAVKRMNDTFPSCWVCKCTCKKLRKYNFSSKKFALSWECKTVTYYWFQILPLTDLMDECSKLHQLILTHQNTIVKVFHFCLSCWIYSDLCL